MKSPTETDNRKIFLRPLRRSFTTTVTTLANLRAIEDGTFLHPREETGTWENRDALLAAYGRIKPQLELAIVEVQQFREETAEFEIWITGEVFSEGGNLFFRADRPF